MNVKLAFVGPSGAGKTRLANHLGGISSVVDEPTVGVRILLLERDVKLNSGTVVNCKVELWDCSGDHKYESCWPAILQNLDGIIVCFDPTSKQQAADVGIWCDWFCKGGQLTTGQCTIFAHGNLTAVHKPFKVQIGTRSVMAPIVNVNTGAKPKEGEEAGSAEKAPTTAELEFMTALTSAAQLVYDKS